MLEAFYDFGRAAKSIRLFVLIFFAALRLRSVSGKKYFHSDSYQDLHAGLAQDMSLRLNEQCMLRQGHEGAVLF
jgi:hypothetical protein